MGYSLTLLSAVHPGIDGLPHVKQLITSFLRPRFLSISDACRLDSIDLLDWIWHSSCTSVDARTPEWSLQNYLRSDPYYHRYQFGKALQFAVKAGDLELVGWLFASFSGCIVPADVVEVAASNGDLDILEFLMEHDAGRLGTHLKYRIPNSEEDCVMCEWIPPRPRQGNAITWSTRSVLMAINNGHLELAQWLVGSTPRSFDDDEVTNIIKTALWKNNLELAERLVPEGRSLLHVEYARGTPSVQSIEWMLARGYLRPGEDIQPWLFLFLTRKDRLDLMQQIWGIFAASRDTVDVDSWVAHWSRTMREAAAHGNLPVLQWLAEQSVGRQVCANIGYHSLSAIVCDAAQGGHFHVVQYLCEQGELKPGSYHRSAMVFAIQKGSVDCVKLLLEHTSYFEDLSAQDAIKEAATRGQLEILEYFHSLDMSEKFSLLQKRRQRKRQRTQKPRKPWWPRCRCLVGQAAIQGQLAVLQWLRRNRWKECCPEKESTEAMDYAATNGHLGVLEWLHTIKSMACSTAAMDDAAANGHLHVVQWLHHNRTEGCTTNAMDVAAQNGHLNVVQWLHANRTEGCTANAVDFAATNGWFEVVKWLWGNRTEGCTSDAIDQAVARCNDQIVHWLLSNTSVSCTSAAMENYPQLDIMQWLHSTGRGVFTQKVIERVIIVGNVRAVAWLHRDFPELKPAKVDLWDEGCYFDMLLFLRMHYLCVFSWEFIETIVALGIKPNEPAHEMNVVGWLLNEFPDKARGLKNDVLWRRPDVDFAGSLLA